MKLTTKGRYAVMALADLALHGKAQPVSLSDIALRQNISLSYLEQLFGKLRRGGLVKSVRGPGGGYLMGHDPGDTRIADIILAVDEPLKATRCHAGSPQGCMMNGTRCLTHDLWDEMGRQIHLFLSSVSLADVISGRLRHKRLKELASEPSVTEPSMAVPRAQPPQVSPKPSIHAFRIP